MKFENPIYKKAYDFVWQNSKARVYSLSDDFLSCSIVNLMKKAITLLTVILLLSCGGNEENRILGNKEYKVKYEALIDQPELYDLKVVYTVGNATSATDTKNIKEETVASPFSHELTLKSGTFISLSIYKVYKGDKIDPREGTITGCIYVDGKKEFEKSDKLLVTSGFVLGF